MWRDGGCGVWYLELAGFRGSVYWAMDGGGFRGTFCDWKLKAKFPDMPQAKAAVEAAALMAAVEAMHAAAHGRGV